MLFGNDIAIVKSLHAALDCEFEGCCCFLHVLNANLVVPGRECSEMVFEVRLSSLRFDLFSFRVGESKSKFFCVRCYFNHS